MRPPGKADASSETSSGPPRSWSASQLGAVAVALALIVLPLVITVSLPSPGFKNTAPVNYRQLTSGPWNDTSPAWSPDGDYVAYTSDRQGGWALFVSPLYGVGERQLTPSGKTIAHPSWSHDSTRIAYWSLDGNVSSIRVVTLSNDSITTISGIDQTPVNMTPVWSPDGSRLLFSVAGTPARLVWADLDARASGVAAELNVPDVNPRWAGPDRVVYTDSEEGLLAMHWANITSGESGTLSEGGADFLGGVVSPDGTRIAYYSNVTGTRLQYLPPDGYNVWVNSLNLTEIDVWTQRLSSFHASYMYQLILHNYKIRPGEIVPTDPLLWSSDGHLLAFVLVSSESGIGVWVWSVDNSTVTRMGPSGARGSSPSWSPDQPSLAFSCNASGTWHIWIADYAAYNPAATY